MDIFRNKYFIILFLHFQTRQQEREKVEEESIGIFDGEYSLIDNMEKANK